LSTTEIQIAFWFPIAPLYGISLLTTTSSGRQMINARVGSVSLNGNGNRPANELSGVFAPNARSFAPRGGTLMSAGAGEGVGSAASHHSGGRFLGATGDRAPAPLQIKVEREVVHEVDDFDEDLSGSSAGTRSAPRGESILMREKGQARSEV